MFIKIALWLVAIFVIWQILIRLLRKRFHFPAPAFIGRFLDSDVRRRMQPPQEIIERSLIKPGMQVLEVGCGSGAYTTFVARAVGEGGRVFALDIQPAMLKQIEAKLLKPQNQDIKNITLLQASAYEIPLPDKTIDLVYLITVLQEIPDRDKALSEIRRVLRPGGILAVTEFLPDPDYPLRSTTVAIVEKNGFILDGMEGNFWTYTVRLKKTS